MNQNQSNTSGIKIVGFDPSLRNWGIAQGMLYTSQGFNPRVEIVKLSTITPELPTGKQVRQNSLDLESAKQLCTAALAAAKDAQAIFVEVPIGSQSAQMGVLPSNR